MAKAKARKSRAARRTRKAAHTTRGAGRKSARKPIRKTAARKAAGRKTAAKSRAGGRASAAARTGKTSTGTAKPRIGTAKGGPRRAAPLANPRGSSGPGTNPHPTKPSTHTGAGAGVSRSPYLERERKRLREVEETVPTPPSSLDLDRSASAVRTGRAELNEALHEHTETSPALTGGDVDADWENAASSGEEAPGGDNPTPDQQRVDDIGKALGLEYQDNEELQGVNKVDKRDKHRWELDPASAEDYRDRQK
jgi:hypothetical protein